MIGTDQDQHELILEKAGKVVRWSPKAMASSKGAAVEVYEQGQRALAAGDYIRWTQNRKNLGIYNTETAKVIKTIGHIAIFELKNKKTIELDLREPINSHWDYAWVSTVYAAQGKKARHVIAQLESDNPNLNNYRSFYVTISRAVNSVHLYVDNLDKAIKTVQAHTGEKSNASEFLVAFKEKQAVEHSIQSAYLKIDGNIHTHAMLSERLAALASHYANANKRSKTYLLATDLKDRQRLNALIRCELKNKGVLAQSDILINNLRRYTIRSHDNHMALQTGMVIRFQRGYKKQQIVKGTYYTVKSVAELENVAIVVDHLGKEAQVAIPFLAARQRKDIEIYKVDQVPLAVGDEILWTRSFNADGIRAGQPAVVTGIEGSEISFKLHNQTTLTANINDPKVRHWQYAYARNLGDTLPNQYDYALAHIDERTRAPARLAAIFGAMGRAQKSAHIYTHSKDYVVSQLRFASKQNINLSAYDSKEIDRAFYKKLEAFDAARKITSKAWVSYFDRKNLGLDTQETWRNAVILDKAQAELAGQLMASKEYQQAKVRALGLDTKQIEQYANKHRATNLIAQYQKAEGILKGYYATIIASEINSQAFKRPDIDWHQLHQVSRVYQDKIRRLMWTPEQRSAARLMDAYFTYSEEASKCWAKIYKVKERGLNPDLTKVAYANHVTNLRNQLAKEINCHPEKYQHSLRYLSDKTIATIKKQAQAFDTTLKRSAKRDLVVNTQDWREILADDQQQFSNQQSLQYTKQANKVYWDKESVLKAALPKAEEIISSLIAEEKNHRLSKGDKLVWGRKNGSVHFHGSGPKSGLINDYERNIHGDLITFYAKSKGLDWYDGLSALAADIGINPELNKASSLTISPDAKQKKQQAMLKDQKRREASRQLAEKTWDEAQPIAGTLVETYLKKHRGATFDVSKLDVRFHPHAPLYRYKDGKLDVFARKPAMVVRFGNEADELTAVQCTYLDPQTANKDSSLNVVKSTIGSQWGSAGCIYAGGDEKVIIAEGAETGMSLVEAEPNASIYITGGNMQNVQHYDFLAFKHGQKEMHIIADNDLSREAGSWKAVERGAESLAKANIVPWVYQPESIRGKKTDFNDVYKRYGSAEVKRQFQPKYSIDVYNKMDKTTGLQPIDSIVKQEPRTGELSYRVPYVTDSRGDQAKTHIRHQELGLDDREK